jgi:hypothetical protein
MSDIGIKGLAWSFPQLIRAWDDYQKKMKGFGAGEERSGYELLWLAISLGLLTAALWVLALHYREMPTWALVLAVLAVLLPIPGGAVITILLALFAKQTTPVLFFG